MVERWWSENTLDSYRKSGKKTLVIFNVEKALGDSTHPREGADRRLLTGCVGPTTGVSGVRENKPSAISVNDNRFGSRQALTTDVYKFSFWKEKI